MRRKWSLILSIFYIFLTFDFIELIKAQRYRKRPKYEKSFFNNHRRAISEEAPTFPPPEDWPIDLRDGQKLNKTMSCALSLVDQYTEVCEIVYRIGQLHQLLPHLNELIIKRMGGRKFIFTLYMNRSSSTVEMLTDAGKSLLRCIGKFIRFLGYVEKLFSATMGTSETSIEKNSQNRRSFFGAPEKDGFLGEVSNIATVDEEEIQKNVKKAWSRKCSLELIKWEKDVCGIISRITKLDSLLKNSILELEPSVSMTLAVKLSSEKLSLTDFFDALHVALSKARNIKEFEGRRAAEIEEKYIGGKRILLNDEEEPIEEIFETPEFKIELIKDNMKNHIVYLQGQKRRSSASTTTPLGDNRRQAMRGRGKPPKIKHKFGGISIQLPEQVIFQQGPARPPQQEYPDYSESSMRRFQKEDPYPFFKPRGFFDELFSSSWGDDDMDYGDWGMGDYGSDDEDDYSSGGGWGIGGFNPGVGGYPGNFFPAMYDKPQNKYQ